MSMKDEIGKIEYHYGFYGAVHAEYEPALVKMEYIQEYELGDEPVRMDMLILKRDETPLTDPIGSFFRIHNVLEYKSPEDHLSINDFYKTQGYALIYKGLGKTADAVPAEELTVSIFRHAYPREMFRRLKETGFGIREAYPGIYYVFGAISVPVQIVITSRLEKGRYETFKALAKNAAREDIVRLLKLTEDYPDPKMIEYVRAVMNVSIILNESVIEEIKEAGLMKKAVERIFKEEMEEKKQEGRQEGFLEALSDLVKDGILSLTDAAKRAGLSPAEFQSKTAGMK